VEKSLAYLRGPDGTAVQAELWDDISTEHVALWTNSWKPEIDRLRQRLSQDEVPREKWPQDLHGDWSEKADVTRAVLAYQRFALVCDGRLQGLMLVNLVTSTGRVAGQHGKHLVYVDFVSTAPWNRPDFCDKPHFVGVGSVLIRVAVELSRAEGFRGRIGLHALPQAEKFYRKTCGMTDLGADTGYYNLTYFEMTEAQATKFTSEPSRQ
jgi:beta-lactamase class A